MVNNRFCPTEYRRLDSLESGYGAFLKWLETLPKDGRPLPSFGDFRRQNPKPFKTLGFSQVFLDAYLERAVWQGFLVRQGGFNDDVELKYFIVS